MFESGVEKHLIKSLQSQAYSDLAGKNPQHSIVESNSI